mgnify:FL=1
MTGIGIDTGGTCTDAVIYDLDTKTVLASAKSATTHERLEIGIGESLGKLPQKLVGQASYISLSTTLATNACVENKGGRVCLIFLGVDRRTVEESYQKYGFEGTDDMRFLDADPAREIEPDWDRLECMLPEILEDYDSIAISQVLPRENNGLYEKEARGRIREKKDITVVCAYVIFKDLNVIRRGAGAFLNARLIPVIEEFFAAVHRVLEEMQIHLPLLIMRSDGSLVSEQYSLQYPVETLLCGPTASVKGAAELMPSKQAVVIDMGGTTSDIAIVKGGIPKEDREGVRVGRWQTFVRGIAIDTFALGGDSQVGYKDKELFLCPRRVWPVTELAGCYPGVLPELEKQLNRYGGNTKPLYEHLVLMKSIRGREKHYTEQEKSICGILKEEPLSMEQLAGRLGTDVYYLDTARLEQEGIVLRSGFTPADAMVLLGDRKGSAYQEEALRAAECAAGFLAKSTGRERQEIPREVYRLVKEKLYCNLVRILWEDAHGNSGAPRDLELFAREAFAAEMREMQGDCAGEDHSFFRNRFSTDAALLGVGAPTHVFLEDVARALHTRGVLSEYSGVCNALGALLGDVCVYETVYIQVDYVISNWDVESEKFVVYGDEKETFFSMEEAAARAVVLAEHRAEKKARDCGAGEIYSLTHTVKKKEGSTNLGSVLLGARVTACARGKYRL